MKFHEYETIPSSFRRARKQFPHLPAITREDIMRVWFNPQGGSMERMHAQFDCLWEGGRRPYYRIYPSLIPMLTRLNLNRVQGSNIHLPPGLPCLSVQFPVGHELHGEIRTMWLSFVDVDPNSTLQTSRGLSIGLDHGEVRCDMPVQLIRWLPLSDKTIEESLNALPADIPSLAGKQLDDAIVKDAIRLACTLCLIGDDPSILEPEVLAKDRHRVDQSNIENLVEKARRRGKLGWSLGRSIETIPHYRRPHPALVWTGVGRKVPKIIMRAGSVVHRDAVAAVPTGYGDDGDAKQVLP